MPSNLPLSQLDPHEAAPADQVSVVTEDTGQLLPQQVWLKGKLTYIGVILASIGPILKVFFHVDIAADETSSLLKTLANSQDLATIVGLGIAIFGRYRMGHKSYDAPIPKAEVVS